MSLPLADSNRVRFCLGPLGPVSLWNVFTIRYFTFCFIWIGLVSVWDILLWIVFTIRLCVFHFGMSLPFDFGFLFGLKRV